MKNFFLVQWVSLASEKTTFETIDIWPLNINVMQGEINRQKVSICDCNLQLKISYNQLVLKFH
jgi:hypothetical protein